MKKPTPAVLFLSDVVFFVFAAAAVFFLLLARTGGEIRGYALLSAALGFFLFRMTVSKPLFFIFRFFWSAVAFARRFISGAGGYLLKKCKSGAAFVACNVILFLRGCKKVLKNAVCLLYNKGKCGKAGENADARTK